MTGVTNPTGYMSPAGPLPRPASAAPAQAFSIDAELVRVRSMLYSANPADVTVAVYQLEALAPSYRAHVLPLLLDQLGPHGNEFASRAAIDVLLRLRAPEAVGPLLHLSQTSPSSSVRVAATSAYHQLTGAPVAGQPTAPAVTYAQPGFGASPAPVQPPLPMPTAPATAPPGLDASYMANFTPRLLNPSTAPAAAVELAQLPMPALLSIAVPLVRDYQLDPRTLGLLTTILAHRAKESPEAAEALRAILHKGDPDNARALNKAALGLLSTRNPIYLNDLLRFLTIRSPELQGAKRVIIEKMMNDPRVLAMPALPLVLRAVLSEQESPELAAAASATLARMRNVQAREALASSPLFVSPDPRLRMQAVVDLGAYPGPYPHAGTQALMGLSQDSDPHVAAAATRVLQAAQASPAQAAPVAQPPRPAQ